MDKNRVDEFWQEFLAEAGLPTDSTYVEVGYFGDSEEMATELLTLIMSGQKTATCSSAFTVCPDFKVGDYCIATDWQGEPHAVTQVVALTHMRFNEMTYDICKREGEDDNLESWQEAHRQFFTEEGKREGYVFSEDMPIVFEDFKVVYAHVGARIARP